MIWREQGIGDEIQFLRFLPRLEDYAASLLYEGDPRLAALLKRSFPSIDIHPILNGALLPNVVGDGDFDCHAPLGDIGDLLDGIGFGSAAPYFEADSAATAKLRHQFESSFGARKLIGVAGFSKNAEHGAGRSIPLDALVPVLSRKDYEFVSVQYGDVSKLLEDFHRETGRVVRNFSGIDLYNQIDQSAAVLSALDGLITIDNTTAHLAGALGVQTALLLPQAVDWRWQCPTEAGGGQIYASRRLFRQGKQGDWDAPVAALGAAMDGLFQRA